MPICPSCGKEAGDDKLCRVCGAEVSACRPSGERVAGDFHADDIGFIKGNIDASVHINKFYVNAAQGKGGGRPQDAGQRNSSGVENYLNSASTIVPGQNPPTGPVNGELKVSSVISERYLIVAFLGRGGIGEAYHVKDLKLNNEDRVLKFMRTDLRDDAGLLSRFTKEVQIASKLAHGNVVRVFDIGEHEGRPYVSMELVFGVTLRAWLNKKKNRGEDASVVEFLDIARGVSAGLAHIHDHDIVHRDIKPENIMVEPSGNPKIMDLGISKLLDYERSHKAGSTATAGTRHYMSPEQERGEAPSFRDDIYACGLVFYEVLTGKSPTHLRPLKDAAPRIPRKMAKIVDRCLQEDPARRFAHGSALAAALKESPPPPTIRYLIMAVGILAVLVVVGFFYFRGGSAGPPKGGNAPVVCSPSSSPEDVLNLAEASLKDKDYSKAIPLLESLGEYKNGAAMEELGSIYHMGEGFIDLQKAKTHYENAYRVYHRNFDTAIESEKSNLIRPNLVYNLMCVEALQGESAAALERLEEFAGLANSYSFPERRELIAKLDTDPELDNIRQLLRFKEIRQRTRSHHPEKEQ